MGDDLDPDHWGPDDEDGFAAVVTTIIICAVLYISYLFMR